MKKAIGIILIAFSLTACDNSSHQTGVDNDGIKTVDSNGGLADTVNTTNPSATDTSKGEDRVDISNRDTIKNKQ
jgi:uncharacterized protein YcfL